jgi:hypothetical protein
MLYPNARFRAYRKRSASMPGNKELTIRVPAGVLAWLESEATIINADLQLLGQHGDVTPGDVATVLMERGIATTLARPSEHEYTEPHEYERAVNE